jgi:salicylate hydroxylase
MAGTQCKFFSTISTSHTTFFLRSTNDTCVNSNNSLTQLLSCVETVDKWKLMHRAELASWINPQANLVLIGDSCHPMLPYLAQGANSSIEDGAVLGLLLAPHYFSSKAQLPETLKLFERVRKERGEQIARETFKQRHDFHMRDGPEREARDALMLGMLGRQVKGPFPSRWTCPDVQSWLYGYDAVAAVASAVASSAHKV